MIVEDTTTIELLGKARAGDRSAMEGLAVAVWQRLYPFVLRTTLDADVTEDVLQETLLNLLCRVESLRDPQRFWPWMYRVACSRIQDRYRRQRLHRSVLSRLSRARHGTADQPNRLEVKMHEETLQQVAAEVERLNGQQRDVVRMRGYEQLPYAEIASRMHMTPQKARVRFHRAKKSLRKRLACCL
jgi:RNA polymerase sigma-70 factor (ECF subfamily)